MRLDHTDPDSVTKCINATKHTLYGLRRNLRAELAERQRAIPGCVKTTELDVRLVSNEDGELWFATGDVQYDTVHGVACEAISLSDTDTDNAVDALAAELVNGVADRLADIVE